MKYWAFIIYSHTDASTARRLHHALETYAIPRSLIGKPLNGEQIPPSPASASSRWVNREIEVFQDLGRILIKERAVRSAGKMPALWAAGILPAPATH